MEHNVEKYLPYLDEMDLSEEEKVEVIKALWTMLETCFLRVKKKLKPLKVI